MSTPADGYGWAMDGRVTAGAVAGVVGTLALDVATYVDMALRGRPALLSRRSPLLLTDGRRPS